MVFLVRDLAQYSPLNSLQCYSLFVSPSSLHILPLVLMSGHYWVFAVHLLALMSLHMLLSGPGCLLLTFGWSNSCSAFKTQPRSFSRKLFLIGWDWVPHLWVASLLGCNYPFIIYWSPLLCSEQGLYVIILFIL